MSDVKIPLITPFLDFIEGFGFNYAPVLAVIGLVCFFVMLNWIDVSQSQVITWLFYTAPIWLPYITFKLLFTKWVEWTRKKNVWESNQKILRVVLPPEVLKTPEAMEIFFTQASLSGAADNLWQVYIDGKHAPTVSYEIVSRGGDINFYIVVGEKPAQLIKDNLYAQYPGLTIQEVELDYTAEVPNDLEGWAYVSFHMNKKKDDHIPLKSYIDMGLDKPQKDEEKVDPITPLLEVMGSADPGHTYWVQFLTRAHRGYNWKTGNLSLSEQPPDWSKAAAATINEMMQRNEKKISTANETEETPRLTPGERKSVETIERHISKIAHEVQIRWVIMSEPGVKFEAPKHIGKMLRAFGQTEVKGGQGISMRWRTDFDYKWFSDPFGKKLPALKRQELAEYKKRILYNKNQAMGWKVYSAEELATLYHFPGTVALTPTLNRIGSTQGEAPNNLPTGNLPTR